MLILHTSYRQVAINTNKQESFTPNGREPSELLALGVNIGGIRIERDKSRKLKYLKRLRTGATHNSYWVNSSCLLLGFQPDTLYALA